MIRAILPIALAGLTAGCLVTDALDRLAEYEERQFVLEPSSRPGIVQTSGQQNTGACYPGILERRGARSELLATWNRSPEVRNAGPLVGYDSILLRGSDPFPCNLWVFHDFQVVAQFEPLIVLPRNAVLQKAELQIALEGLNVLDGGVRSAPCRYVVGEIISAPPFDRFTQVGGAQRAVTFGATRPESRIGDVNFFARANLDVTRTFMNWFNGRKPNRGLVISIEDGTSFRQHDEEDDYAYCAAQIREMNVVLTALVPPSP